MTTVANLKDLYLHGFIQDVEYISRLALLGLFDPALSSDPMDVPAFPVISELDPLVWTVLADEPVVPAPEIADKAHIIASPYAEKLVPTPPIRSVKSKIVNLMLFVESNLK